MPAPAHPARRASSSGGGGGDGTRTFAEWMTARPHTTRAGGRGGSGTFRLDSGGGVRVRTAGARDTVLAGGATPGAQPVAVGEGVQLVPGVRREVSPSDGARTSSARARKGGHTSSPPPPPQQQQQQRLWRPEPPPGSASARSTVTPSMASPATALGVDMGRASVFTTPSLAQHAHTYSGMGSVGGGGMGANSTGGFERSAGNNAPLNTTTGKWRSTALFHEVALKELLADEYRTPCAERVKKTLEHYDAVAAQFPNFRAVFELIRSELCLSIYASGVTSAGGIEPVPYFEVFGQLRRENEELQSELEEARDESNKDALYFDLQAKKSRARYLAHQVDLLTQENEGLLEDVAKLTVENEAVTRNGRQTFCDLDLQNRTTKAQIRRLENENAAITHENVRHKSNLADFTSLKHAQTGCIVKMFDRRYEFAAHVQLMCHLEVCVNYILNDYDVSLHGVSQTEAVAARGRMVGRARVIIAEICELENSCLLLMNEKVGAASESGPLALTDRNARGQTKQMIVGSRPTSSPVVNARLQNRHLQQQAASASASARAGWTGDAAEDATVCSDERGQTSSQLSGHGGRESVDRDDSGVDDATSVRGSDAPRALDGGHASGSLTGGRQPGSAAGTRPSSRADAGDAAEYTTILQALASNHPRDRDVFVKNLMKKLPSCAPKVLHATIHELKGTISQADPLDSLQHDLYLPMLDTDPAKFDNRIDVYCVSGKTGAGTAPPHPQLFKSLNTIDPTAVIDLPTKTTAVQFKFVKPDGARLFPTAEQHQQQQQQQRERELDESQMTQQQGGGRDEGDAGGAAQSKNNYPPGLAAEIARALPQEVLEETLRCARGEHAAWRVYDLVHGPWAPRVPRILDERLVEELIFEAYQYESFRVHNQYIASVNENPGATRDARDRAFFAKLSEHSLMEAVEPILERRYHLPLIVRKYTFELLATCEQLNTKVAQWFLKALVPSEGEVAAGRVLSAIFRLLEVHWPLSPLKDEELLSQQELAAVLQQLYPSYPPNRIDTIVSDLAIFTRAEFSLKNVRAFFTSKVVGRTEAYIQDAERAIDFKATTLKWKELDRFDFADACCTALNVSDDVSLDAVRVRLKYRHLEVCHRSRATSMRLGVDVLSLLAAETVWLAIMDDPGGLLKPKKNTVA